MRKFILITALLLASASAQAGQPRGLTLASNDAPTAAEKIDSVKPEASKPEAVKPEAAQPEASKPEASKPTASKPVEKVHARTHRGYEGDEARARTIAARYGISW
jgi:hypothetical protein